VSISVLLADDQPLLRRGFRMILETEEDLTVVAEAGNGEEAVDLARQHAPDVVLMDIRMPGTDGIEATHRITAADARVRVLGPARALVEPADHVTKRGDVAVVPVGQPLGEPAPHGLGGGGQVLLPGGGQRELAPSPARPLSLPPQQPGRDQLLELPRHGGLVQAEVGGQVGRARRRRDVDLGQQRVGDQGHVGVEVVAQVTGPPDHRGQALVQILEAASRLIISSSRVAKYNSMA